jgi:DNA-binding CsgD family transcriptional regulator
MRRDIKLHSKLVHEIYSASVRPERWNQVVSSIAASFGCGKGLLFTPLVAPQNGRMMLGAGIDEPSLQVWGTHYRGEDAWTWNLQQKGMLLDGAAYTDEEILPRAELLQSPFYRQFLSTLDISRVCAGICFQGSPDRPMTALSVFRGENDHAFDRDDVRWMEILVSHISRSTGLLEELNSARLQNASLLASYDRLNFGLVLLDKDMRVLHRNKAFEEVLDRRDGIFIDDQRRLQSLPTTVRLQSPSGVAFSDRRRKARLNLSDWLAQVGNRLVLEEELFQDGYVLTRTATHDSIGRTTRRHYLIQCAPAMAVGEECAGWRSAVPERQQVGFVLYITDPQSVQLPSVERLCSLYDLTPAQAKVVCAFAGGGTYKDVAHRLSVGEETIRAHLKEIYPKTRVNRLADLVRLTLSLSQNAI